MSVISAFMPMGNSVILTTNAVASTSTSVAVVLAGSGNLGLPSTQPFQISFLNTGTDMIWINLSSPSAATAVIPSAGTTTLGTPRPVFWIAPNAEKIITLPIGIAPLLPAGTGIGFWLNNISAGINQNFQMQLGEGL